MITTPSQSKAAHDALGKYRNAVADARRAADDLMTAAANARAAGRVLQPYVESPVPTVAWEGQPPVAEWESSVETLIAEAKAGLAA